ncbi:MAG: hypothetical protein WDL87_02350 [Candidatus Omnitrophota bacterium]|jgi:hypothetical protein
MYDNLVPISEVIKLVLLCLNPLIFIIGLVMFLVNEERFRRLEKNFDHELGIKRKLVPSLENNIFTFHEFLLKKKMIVGIVFVIYAVLSYVIWMS